MYEILNLKKLTSLYWRIFENRRPLATQPTKYWRVENSDDQVSAAVKLCLDVITNVSVGYVLSPSWFPWQSMRDLEETKDPKQGNGSEHSRSNSWPHALCGPSQVQWQPVCQSRDLGVTAATLTCPLPLHPIIICQHPTHVTAEIRQLPISLCPADLGRLIRSRI